MYRMLHGWISLFLMAIVFSTGCVAIFRVNRLMVIAYLMSSAFGMVGVLYAFCAKCTCRNACRHIILGPLTRFLPRREVAPYTFADIAMTAVGISPLLLFPQYWLFGQKTLLLFFWQLTAALVIEIVLFVCKGCENAHCPARRMRR